MRANNNSISLDASEEGGADPGVPGQDARYDVAFGGAFYAFCREEDLGVSLKPESFRQIIDLGMEVKRGVMASLPIRHPFEEDPPFFKNVDWSKSQDNLVYFRNETA